MRRKRCVGCGRLTGTGANASKVTAPIRRMKREHKEAVRDFIIGAPGAAEKGAEKERQKQRMAEHRKRAHILT